MNNDYETKKGIHYYNLYKLDNKENKHNTFPLIGEETDNELLSVRGGLAAREEEIVTPVTPENHVGSSAAILDKQQLRGCVIQLFDNGADTVQQYKLKIRLNLIDSTNPEFIAPLTKRLQNFKKYIPEPYRDGIIEAAQEYRKALKHKFGVFPYIGKFHFNQGRATGRQKIEVEPNTMCVVWYNSTDQHWSFILQIHEFVLEGDLDETYLTAKQKAIGVKSQYVYKNPQYDTAQRPLTWAEQRRLKNAK